MDTYNNFIRLNVIVYVSCYDNQKLDTFNLKCQCNYYIGLECNSTFKSRLGDFVSFINFLNEDLIVLRYESLTLIGHGIDIRH